MPDVPDNFVGVPDIGTGEFRDFELVTEMVDNFRANVCDVAVGSRFDVSKPFERSPFDLACKFASESLLTLL